MAGLASLGAKPAYLGKVADDDLGRLFARDLHAIGVSFETAPLKGGDPTARSMIFVTPDAQRSMNTFLGASVEFSEKDVDAAIVSGAPITYLEGYLFDKPAAQNAFRKAAQIVRDNGHKLALTLSDSFCVERHREAFRALVQKETDILFSNEAELTALYQTKTLDEALTAARAECGMVVSTRGDKGVVIATPLEVTTVPSLTEVKLVDTTGAGDLFAAGFLFGLIREMDLATCGRLGHIAAAEAISHYGPRPQTSLKELASKVL
jgi:sugar/nucleoside kinase (ribokinase family)